MVAADDVITFFILLTLSSITLSSYILIMVAIKEIYRKTRNAFYLLLLALGISDSVMLSLFLFYSTTATLVQTPPFGVLFDALFVGTICNVTYFSSLALLVAIASNRYVAVCSKIPATRVYNRKKIQISIACCFVFGFVSSIPQLTPCCSMRYYEKKYTYSYDLDLNGNHVFVWYDRLLNLITFTSLVLFYSLIFKRVRDTKKTQGRGNMHNSVIYRKKTDIRLAIQSGLNACFLIVFGLSFTIIPLVTSSKWWSLVSSIMYIAAVGIHPFVYFGYNEQIRKRVKHIIFCKEDHVVESEKLSKTFGQGTPRVINASPKNRSIRCESSQILNVISIINRIDVTI